MKIKLGKVSRLGYGLAALSLTVAISASMVVPGLVGQASAAQVTARSIQMGSSLASATNVAYKVGFTVATTGNIGGIVVDFCSNDPIIGDTCTAPTGFNVNRATTSLNNQTGITGFSVYTSDATNNRIIITKASATSVSGAVSFELGNGTSNGITNPSTVDSFYARIYTYTTAAAAQGHVTDTPTGYVDYGGIALAITDAINITARVQETLSFCVYADDNGSGAGTGTCGDGADLDVGHTSGTTKIIDSSVVDTAAVDFDLSTNAQSGAVVNLKGDTLKSGSNDINAIGGTANPINAGTENFGLRISTAGTNITRTAPYNDNTNYGLDTASTTSTYGDQICTLSGPTNSSVSTITYAATASLTTPAGLYTATHQLIATGTF
jgi:hypothetical protein